MSKNIRIIFTFYFIAVLSGCASTESISVAERRWTEKLDKFQPIGKTRKMLLMWLMENNVPINSLPKEEVILESITGDGFVCSKWHVLLSVSFNVSENIETYSVSSAGTCI